MPRKDGNSHFHNGRPASRTRKARKRRGQLKESRRYKQGHKN